MAKVIDVKYGTKKLYILSSWSLKPFANICEVNISGALRFNHANATWLPVDADTFFFYL